VLGITDSAILSLLKTVSVAYKYESTIPIFYLFSNNLELSECLVSMKCV